MQSVLWWGRFDPRYSRNRLLRRLFVELGWELRDFRPRFSVLADTEARLRRLPVPDLVWVPCFRQRDLAAASRFSRAHGVPLVFDPLISAYDKQVDERGKLAAESGRAKCLLAWERRLFARADRIVADTPAHADYFANVLGVARNQLAVVYVGAEDDVFTPQPLRRRGAGEALEVMFYGSFIPLQGPQTIVEAARRYVGPPVRWTLIGQGPLRQACEDNAKGLDNVRFEDWLPYETLPGRIHQADILLGVFGTTPKAGRVIPNKVYQSLACGRVVVTRPSPAYPEELQHMPDCGLAWSMPGDAGSLASQVADLARDPARLAALSGAASGAFRRFFSRPVILDQLRRAIDGLTERRR